MGKGNKKNLWIFIIILLVVLIISGLVYLIRVASVSDIYEGKNGEYEIMTSKVGNVDFYHLTISNSENTKYTYSFRNHPEDLESIPLEPLLLPKINRPQGIKYLIVTQDSELANMTQADSVIAINSFEQVLGGGASLYNLQIFNTYTDQVRENLPAVTCANVTNQIAVIYLKVGDESKIYSEGDCVVIQGRGGNGLIMASEKFAYSLLGVF